MDAHYLFRDLAFVFIAAVGGGLLAWRLKQPLILGYVLAGIAISPLTPGPSVHDVKTLENFAEMGVIFLMFSVGLEFSIKDLLQVKWVALVGGPLGIVLAIGMGAGAARLLGWSLPTGLVIGTVVSVTSTMVLMRLLMDRGEIQTQPGRITVAITLVEDLAAVVLIVLIPSFKTLEKEDLLALLWALGKAAVVLVPAFILAAKVVPGFMRRVARTHDQELFFVVVIAICLGAAALTQLVGLSLALGAFVGGLLISGSEYAHQSLTQLLPLRDIFVALFFVSIGLLMDPQSVLSSPVLLRMVAAMVVLIVLGKFLLWFGIVRLFRYPVWTALVVAIGLTQIGEFSYIFVQVARTSGVVGDDVYNATLAASLITIVINAALVKYAPDWAARLRARKKGAAVPVAEAGVDKLRGHVVLCGYGEVGEMVARAFESFRVPYAVVDMDPEAIRDLRRRGVPCVFGDPVHARILEHAHVESAAAVVVAVAHSAQAELVVRRVRKLNAEVPVLARAHHRADYGQLLDAGASIVIQPEMEASATLVRDALGIVKLPESATASYLTQLRKAHTH